MINRVSWVNIKNSSLNCPESKHSTSLCTHYTPKSWPESSYKKKILANVNEVEKENLLARTTISATFLFQDRILWQQQKQQIRNKSCCLIKWGRQGEALAVKKTLAVKHLLKEGGRKVGTRITISFHLCLPLPLSQRRQTTLQLMLLTY